MKLSLTKNETEIWISLVSSADKLVSKIDSELKKNGLPPLSWYDVLLELDKSREGKLRFVALGKRVLMSRYSVSRTVNRLEKKGLAKREESKDDARGCFAVITRKGRSVRKKMWPIYYKVLREYLFSSVNEKEQEVLLRNLRKINKSLEK